MTSQIARYLQFCLLCIAVTAVLSACSSSAKEPAPASTPTSPPSPTSLSPSATPLPPTDTPKSTATAEPAAITHLRYVTAVDPEAQDETLDLYYLPGSNAAKPVVIWAHGSDLDSGTGRTFGRILARDGYVVLSLNWQDLVTRGGGTADLREAVEDAVCALRFAAEHGEEYGADPSRVIWAGFSAGAWLGSIVSIGDGDPTAVLDAYAAQNDVPDRRVDCLAAADPAQITAFIPSAGAYPGDFWLGNGDNPFYSELMAPLAEYTAVGHNPDLQVRILHGKNDRAGDTAFDNAQAFADALQQAGYDVLFLPQDGAHESFQTQVIEQILALEE